ncbi:glycosyltransferase family 9 protein [Cellulomonas dongxiuzhuiae]|uniref:Glycosyltransferase family 9 protein n=1 Tax=Cellulomonas dongxiuzhuiae TaxID=2819979 RepID=A0ABX8GNZ4_9CELL|nr:glycosyltransferase family 9 protein [Cellulomonas dongxiuzhuiae]MBO3093334.1 glycosyltransferase family 9 protein [Cellulomonas dongxiuzhuiae]QWC17615.1 glycosyltransferase family 9 protein [Cellulomonas dongxiuzhuiae]
MSGARTTGDVLVLRALGLGDALTGVAALRGVRRAWPDRRLVLAGPAATGTWLRDLGVVDDLLVTQGLAPLTWDGTGHVAVNLHGRGPQSHRVLAATRPSRLVAYATPEHPQGPTWRADEHEVVRWCRLVTSAGGPCDASDLRLPVPPDRATAPGTVVLHPGAASGSRRWPVARWGEVARALVAARQDVTLTGGPAEVDLCAAVAEASGRDPRVLAGSLDVPGLAGLVAGARLVVCGDTGVAHLATAVATPSVLLFGPTPPRWWGPAIDSDRHAVLWHGDPHRPGDPHGTDVDPALTAITVDEVLEAAVALLAAPAPHGHASG